MSKHMTLDDRRIIERMYRDGASVADIANSLGRNLSNIYRELDRGATGKLDKNGNAEYSAKIADGIADELRSNRGRPRNAKRLIQHH